MQTIYFRLPFGEDFFTVNPSTKDNAVIFHSFNGNREIHFHGEIEVIKEEQLKENLLSNILLSKKYRNTPENNEEYVQKTEKVISIIKENSLPKVVISRLKWQENKTEKGLDLISTFLQMAKDYQNAFVYLMINENDAWIGATPEVLGQYNKASHTFKTMSLAGTLPVTEEWTEKEIEEQKPVSLYIKSILEAYSDKVEMTETYDHISGNIKHLRNDFESQIDAFSLENIIKDLHPTPAVCGVPKDLCQQIIQDTEGYNRQFYAGYIRVETQSDILYFVNLRCAELYNNGALLYVGGGITAMSDPQKEWRETELKSEAVGKRLRFFKA